MRIWTIHPRYLDPKGLVALWRETLLAQHVLAGKTKGYTNHPQLLRFKAHPEPLGAINSYLAAVYVEALNRGYAFDQSKIGALRSDLPIQASNGQLAYEWDHLKAKLQLRAPTLYEAVAELAQPEAHPLFTLVEGPIAEWEIISPAAKKA